MDLKRQHVWDYVGDNYVHRLIQNKGDGKLVELRGEGVSTFELVSRILIILSFILPFSFRMITMKVIQKSILHTRKSIRWNLKYI